MTFKIRFTQCLLLGRILPAVLVKYQQPRTRCCVYMYVAAVSADGANLYIVNDSDNTLHLHTPEQATYVSYVTIACVINSKHRYNHIDGCGCN